MNEAIKRYYKFFTKGLWEIDTGSLSPLRGFIVRSARLVHVLAKQLDEGQLSMRAMSLVYTTLLSLVPLLAVSFSVLKAFGVHNQVRPILQRFLAPLGPKGDEVTMRVVEFVGNMKVGVLGSVGLALLIYTVVSLIYKVESSFNHIWRVKNPRSIARRFTEYMSMLLVGPILAFSAMGLTAAFMSSAFVDWLRGFGPVGAAFYMFHGLLPYIITCAGFTLAYTIIPSARVKLRPALAGGLFAGIIWEVTGWGFAQFVVTSAKYSAIYSGFAILVMFMLWVYISWLILLAGASVSFYHQFPQYLLLADETPSLSNRLRERLAFSVMYLTGQAYHSGGPPWTLDTLVERLAVPIEPLRDTLDMLERKGLLMTSGEDPPAYLPGRDMETIQLAEILATVRTAGERLQAAARTAAPLPDVEIIAEGMERAMSGTLTGRTLRDLVLTGGHGSPATSASPTGGVKV